MPPNENCYHIGYYQGTPTHTSPEESSLGYMLVAVTGLSVHSPALIEFSLLDQLYYTEQNCNHLMMVRSDFVVRKLPKTVFHLRHV